MFDSKEIAKRALREAEVIAKKQKSRTRILSATGICCVCAALAVTAAIYLPTNTAAPGYVSIDDEAIPIAQPANNNTNDERENGFYLIPYIDEATMQTGTTATDLILKNPTGNGCDLAFEILLAETGETLFESQQVKPSWKIESVEFKRPLNEGEYEAVLKVKVYNPDSFDIIRIINVDFLIKCIENS